MRHSEYYEIPLGKISSFKWGTAFSGGFNLDDEVLEVINQDRIKRNLYPLENYNGIEKKIKFRIEI